MAAFTAVDPALRGGLEEPPETVELVAPGVYTATANAEFGVGKRVRIVEVVVLQTAGTAGQSLTVGIDAFNPSTGTAAPGTWENLITSAAISSATTATTVVQVNPYCPPITNSSAQRCVRRRMRVTVTHADNKNVTYSVDVHVEA